MKYILKAILTFLIVNSSFLIIKAQVGNTLQGTNAGSSITTGDSIVAFGFNAGKSVSTGSRSVYIGSDAGYNHQTNDIIAIGHRAGYSNVNGSRHIFIGTNAGYSITHTHHPLILVLI